MSGPLTPEEIEDFLREIYDQAWQFELEEGNLFDDEPDEEPEAEVEEWESPEDAAGWRQSDFIARGGG